MKYVGTLVKIGNVYTSLNELKTAKCTWLWKTQLGQKYLMEIIGQNCCNSLLASFITFNIRYDCPVWFVEKIALWKNNTQYCIMN